MQQRPVRPDSEYGERPAGAPPSPPESAERFGTQEHDSLDRHRGDVLAILKRGGDMGESSIASETPLEPSQVDTLLTRLEQAGLAARTAGGSWRLTPAAESQISEARPHPSEPAQEE